MMDAEDRQLFERSLDDALTGSDVTAALDEVGWRDALEDDERAAISILFELQGRRALATPALEHLAHGSVLPVLGSTHAPGRLEGTTVAVRGLVIAGTTPTTVIASIGDEHRALALPAGALEVRSIHGLDPDLRISEVVGTATAVDIGPVDWPHTVRRCQVAVGHELVGASRSMLELTRTHALDRIQFDVAIASFQAVRHRLADTLIAIETAEAALDAAWLDGSSSSAAIAKALAGRAGWAAAKHGQQVLAGIGFTLEHPFHQYLRRVLVLDELLGSARSLTKDLGRELLQTRQLPALLPL